MHTFIEHPYDANLSRPKYRCADQASHTAFPLCRELVLNPKARCREVDLAAAPLVHKHQIARQVVDRQRRGPWLPRGEENVFRL